MLSKFYVTDDRSDPMTQFLLRGEDQKPGLHVRDGAQQQRMLGFGEANLESRAIMHVGNDEALPSNSGSDNRRKGQV